MQEKAEGLSLECFAFSFRLSRERKREKCLLYSSKGLLSFASAREKRFLQVFLQGQSLNAMHSKGLQEKRPSAFCKRNAFSLLQASKRVSATMHSKGPWPFSSRERGPLAFFLKQGFPQCNETKGFFPQCTLGPSACLCALRACIPQRACTSAFGIPLCAFCNKRKGPSAFFLKAPEKAVPSNALNSSRLEERRLEKGFFLWFWKRPSSCKREGRSAFFLKTRRDTGDSTS